MFPKEITDTVKNLPCTTDSVGRSEDAVYLFGKEYILKVSTDKNMLLHEKEGFDFLTSCGLPGSRSCAFTEKDGKYFYLRTCIDGESLISDRFINDPMLLIDTLAKVVGVLRSLDSKGCPFTSTDNNGCDFVHGDLCLPNIYISASNTLAGFIDLGNSGLGDRWYDYSWLLWSLEYNLGTDKYGKLLLDKLGIEFDKKRFEMYIPEDLRGKHYK